MPQPIYMQRPENPWVQMLPQLLGNMILQKRRQRYEKERLEQAYKNKPTAPKGYNVYWTGEKWDIVKAPKVEARWSDIKIAERGDKTGFSPGTAYQIGPKGKYDIISDPTKGGELPSSIREYEYAKKQGYKGSFADWTTREKTEPSLIQQYNLAKRQGYKGSFTDWKKEMAIAGRSTTTFNVGMERFGLQKQFSAADIRRELTDNAKDKELFAARAPLFNQLNRESEYAYWASKPVKVLGKKLYTSEGATIVKLPYSKQLRRRFTAADIQRTIGEELAKNPGKTEQQIEEEILRHLGVIE